MEHRLTSRDEATMTGHCAKCGPTKLRRKSNGRGRPHRLVCVTTKIDDDRKYKRKPHGLTTGQAREMCESGACALCGSEDDLVVDHCHRTGKVRDVLCRLCNLGLGGFRDRPELLELAIVYLRTHEEART